MASHKVKRRTTVLGAKIFTACLLLLALLRSSMARPRHQPNDARFFTHTCEKKWCGEQWSANSVLCYNYTVTHVLKEINVTTTSSTSNCSGAVNSLECEHAGTEIDHKIQKVWVKNITRSPEPKVTGLQNSLHLGLIFTDNINVTGGLVQDTYPANMDKIWQIKIPPHCRMNIYFSEFLIESSDRCSKDYFSVQTSKSQQDIPRYCDTLHSIEIRNRRRVQLYFHADDSAEKRGFFGSVCLSNWPKVEGQRPCTCESGRRRRSAHSQESSMSQREYRHQMKKEAALDDKKIGQWLTEMMQGGLERVEEILENPECPEQRYLAEQYVEALGSYELQNSIL